MCHLNDVKMTYFQHMLFALTKSLQLMKASFVLIVHSIFPNLLAESGSHLVNQIHYDLMANRTHKNRILVRFNTKWTEDGEKRKWRVLENGIETLAHDVSITIPCTTIQEDVEGSGTRWHFLCYGGVTWNGSSASIR